MAFGEAQLCHLLEAVVGWVGRLVRCHFCDAALVTLPLQLVVVVGARGSGVQCCCGAGLVDVISGVTGVSVTAVLACWT